MRKAIANRCAAILLEEKRWEAFDNLTREELEQIAAKATKKDMIKIIKGYEESVDIVEDAKGFMRFSTSEENSDYVNKLCSKLGL